MNQYLSTARYVDSADPGVLAFSEKNAKGSSERERAVSLYYAVRDQIRYNPFLDFSDPEVFRASAVLKASEGFCVGKASLLAACARRRHRGGVGFADVKNHPHHAAPGRDHGQRDLFIYHGYTDLRIDGKWVKATPAFNLALCARFRVKPLEFDGRADSIPPVRRGRAPPHGVPARPRRLRRRAGGRDPERVPRRLSEALRHGRGRREGNVRLRECSRRAWAARSAADPLKILGAHLPRPPKGRTFVRRRQGGLHGACGGTELGACRALP